MSPGNDHYRRDSRSERTPDPGHKPGKQIQIYISALTQISIDDHNGSDHGYQVNPENRPGSSFRGQTALGTLKLWPRKRGEEKIFPSRKKPTSCLIRPWFELGILKNMPRPYCRRLAGRKRNTAMPETIKLIILFPGCFRTICASQFDFARIHRGQFDSWQQLRKGARLRSFFKCQLADNH